jgi:putative PIN family toxin of toxin-antitoxin system
VSADLRVVLDTNVVISALLLQRSLTRQAFDHASSRSIVLVSAETLEELNDVLRRPKFEKYVGEEERMEFLTAYVREATLVNVTEAVKACRAPGAPTADQWIASWPAMLQHAHPRGREVHVDEKLQAEARGTSTSSARHAAQESACRISSSSR